MPEYTRVISPQIRTLRFNAATPSITLSLLTGVYGGATAPTVVLATTFLDVYTPDDTAIRRLSAVSAAPGTVTFNFDSYVWDLPVGYYFADLLTGNTVYQQSVRLRRLGEGPVITGAA